MGEMNKRKKHLTLALYSILAGGSIGLIAGLIHRGVPVTQSDLEQAIAEFRSNVEGQISPIESRLQEIEVSEREYHSSFRSARNLGFASLNTEMANAHYSDNPEMARRLYSEAITKIDPENLPLELSESAQNLYEQMLMTLDHQNTADHSLLWSIYLGKATLHERLGNKEEANRFREEATRYERFHLIFEVDHEPNTPQLEPPSSVWAKISGQLDELETDLSKLEQLPYQLARIQEKLDAYALEQETITRLVASQREEIAALSERLDQRESRLETRYEEEYRFQRIETEINILLARSKANAGNYGTALVLYQMLVRDLDPNDISNREFLFYISRGQSDVYRTLGVTQTAEFYARKAAEFSTPELQLLFERVPKQK